MGLNLSHGGHLTHGSPVNISGTYFQFDSYGVEAETQTLDYDKIAQRAKEYQPKVIVAGTSAYPRALDY